MRDAGNGKPITIVLTPGERHETTAFEQLMEQGAVKRPGRGCPKLRSQRIVGDKGYSSCKIRAYLRRHGTRIMIPRKTNERRTGPITGRSTATTWSGLINRLKQFRRPATRYEKWTAYHQAMWIIAAPVL